MANITTEGPIPAGASDGPSNDTAHDTDEDVRAPGPLLALAGFVAAGAALAAGELVGAAFSPRPGPVLAVANQVVDSAPTWFVEFGKAVFGLSDKPALIIGTVLLSLLFGTLLGVWSRRSMLPAAAGFAGFGLLGMGAIASDPQGGLLVGVLAAGTAVVVGLGSLAWMRRLVLHPARGYGQTRPPATIDPTTNPTTNPKISPTTPPVSRRRFLEAAGTVGVASAAVAAGATALRGRSSVETARSAVDLASVGSDAAMLSSSELDAVVARAAQGPVGSTPGITPLVVPSDDFYLIDTALVRPRVDPANWSLTIGGMVDNPLEFSYDDLLDRSTTIAPVTLSCVSNEVGGGLVGNAIWQGVPLADLLNEAGVQEGATQIASRSVDDWTCGFPTEAAFDGRTALVAVGMNGEPLPIKHGFPARLVVSGLYGYVSATKWLRSIELTTWESFDGYWIPRGWSKEGPVKLQSRIDTPGDGERVTAGSPVAIAGVAWAPDTGVANVEVRIDDGPWQEAQLGESMGEDAWVQWLLAWTPTEGEHDIAVRATDAEGFTQPEEIVAPRPNGATGWHRKRVVAA